MMKYEITDKDALYKAYPQFFEEVVTKKLVINRRKISHAIKAGFQIPGIRIEGAK